MKLHLLLFFILIFTFSCKSDSKPAVAPPTTIIGTPTCPTEEDLSSNDTTQTINVGQKVGFKFAVNGISGATAYLSKITLYMSSENLTDVTLQVYTITDFIDDDPDEGTLLKTITVTSGLGSADPKTAIDFVFPDLLGLQVSTSLYYTFVISGTGGSFDLSLSSSQIFAAGSLNIYSGVFWANLGGAEDLSVYFYYDHCDGV